MQSSTAPASSSTLNQIGINFCQRIEAALQYEIKLGYINAKGRSGTFADFIRKEATEALRIFKHSHKWTSIRSIIQRYPFTELSTRIHNCKQIREIIKELTEIYQAKEKSLAGFLKKSEEEKLEVDPNIDITDLEVRYVKGVGPRFAEKLERIGVKSCADLLNYMPRDHISYKDKILIKDLVEEEDVTVFGQVDKISAFQSPKKSMVILSIFIKDASGKLKITKFFRGNSTHFYLKQYKHQYPIGSTVLVSGRVKMDKYSKAPTLTNESIEVVSDDFVEGEDNVNTARIVPIYPLTEGLNLTQLRKLIYKTLNAYKGNLHEFIPQDMLDRHDLMPYAEAIQEVHFPTSIEAKEAATRRLSFNEFLLLQLRFMKARDEIKRHSEGIQFNCFENGLVDKFISSLPFPLTYAQERVFYSEILPDMVGKSPMHRLLQGDVGSGKTVVAFLSLLVAVADGYQGALMVPTEILAEQHYKKMQEWVAAMHEEFGIRVGLLLGKQKTKEKRAVLQGLADGSINIVVGTHALIQDAVKFFNLGLIVIDEQHRFGVKQREMLARKASHMHDIQRLNDFESELKELEEHAHDGYNSEHQDKPKIPTVEKLFMTATPIPRTLALTMHGDLDMSEIDEMPAGRSPVITEIVKSRIDAYKRIKDEISKGHQAYIVFPLIDESETLSAKAASVEYEKLKDKTFKDLKLGLIHGKLSDEEKESTMLAFRNREIDILVATTVIEVGVDVPDATVILIESAERFGLAQLHQLRGRVGRSNKQSYCLLASNSKTPTSIARLNILTKTNNGFILAQHDMQLRGAGDFLGIRQSGLPESAICNLTEHEDVLAIARNEARRLIDQDAELEQHPELLKKLENSNYNAALAGG